MIKLVATVPGSEYMQESGTIPLDLPMGIRIEACPYKKLEDGQVEFQIPDQYREQIDSLTEGDLPGGGITIGIRDSP